MTKKEKHKILVREWRKKSNKELIDFMGGRCVICGYNKCYRSLSFHHVDKNNKIHNVSYYTSIGNLKKAYEEAKKCILVCANCHFEIEEGLIEFNFNNIIDSYPKNHIPFEKGSCLKKKCPVSDKNLCNLKKENSYDKLAKMFKVNERTVMRWYRELFNIY